MRYVRIGRVYRWCCDKRVRMRKSAKMAHKRDSYGSGQVNLPNPIQDPCKRLRRKRMLAETGWKIFARRKRKGGTSVAKADEQAHQQRHRFAVKATSEPIRISVSPCSRFALSLRPRAGCAVANEKYMRPARPTRLCAICVGK